MVARVKALGYLDDREYALRRARLMAEKGYGDFSIRIFLEGLDIPEDLVEMTVSQVSQELSEEKRISLLMGRKKGTDREKLVRFLAGKGFPYEKIYSAVGGDE